MAIRDSEKSAFTKNPRTANEEAKHLKADIDTARGHERLLKAKLAALHASPSVGDILAEITTLELEQEDLSNYLGKLQSGEITPPSPAEKEAVNKTDRKSVV